MQDYFNIIGNGFGDFMFNGEELMVEETFRAMTLGDSLNVLKKLTESRLLVFVDPNSVRQSEYQRFSDMKEFTDTTKHLKPEKEKGLVTLYLKIPPPCFIGKYEAHTIMKELLKKDNWD